MANVLNKLLEICEILDTKGGSGSGSTGGGSSGSVSSGEINYKRFKQVYERSMLYDENYVYCLLLGLYDKSKSKDLKVMVDIVDLSSPGLASPLYVLDISTNEFWNSMKIFNVNQKSGSNDSTYGSLTFGLYTITIEGNKFLSLKIVNNNITTANYQLTFSVFGIDTNTSEDNEYTGFRIAREQATQYKEQLISKEALPHYISIYQNDGVLRSS